MAGRIARRQWSTKIGYGDRPWRDREDRPQREEGGDPEFAPAFLTRDDD